MRGPAPMISKYLSAVVTFKRRAGLLLRPEGEKPRRPKECLKRECTLAVNTPPKPNRFSNAKRAFPDGYGDFPEKSRSSAFEASKGSGSFGGKTFQECRV